MGLQKFKRPILVPAIIEAVSASNATGGVTASELAPHVLRTAIVALTAAQLIAMFTTPVQILAAPGAGLALIISEITFEMKRTATAFTGGGAISFQYHTTTSSAPAAGTVAATVVTTAGAATAVVTIDANSGAGGLVVPVNEGIDITNATAAFAAGTGTAQVFVRYRIITT